RRLGQTDAPRQRKALLIVSIVSNLSILAGFKYFNFFIESFADLLSLVGLQPNYPSLGIILPVGISFYTFQTLSYTIDVYRRTLAPATNFLDFALFVAFFPQLVAGPIERAATLLPQISTPRRICWSQVNAGLFLILWGYFKKLVIADNLASTVEEVFEDYTAYQGLDITVAALAFTVQIYGDFSGYSDIARGLAKLMGFELMLNFRLPYFALTPSDFWARWHISLSTWFRDYVYIPLGGNRQGTLLTYRNLAITMLLCGLWHGAAWNFVLWGAFHGLLLIGYRSVRAPLLAIAKSPHPWAGWVLLGQMGVMFGLTTIGWILFRATSMEQIAYMLTHLGWQPSAVSAEFVGDLVFFSAPLLVVQLCQYLSQDLLILTKLPAWGRIPLYGLMLAWMVIFSDRSPSEFIYFQF
ncbi:MAG: MBOAT family O-acyltransferase, partial [Synechococcales bacterium]|nr:MBOAT family O-acyltransferase [Synechococcales bacterium]